MGGILGNIHSQFHGYEKIKGWTVQDLFFSNYLLLQISEIFYEFFFHL